MAHLIDKDALVAEIDNILEYADEHWDTDCAIGAKRFASKLQDAIDTLEVKEVDLEKEIENLIEKEKAFVTDNREVKYYNGDSFNHIYELEFIAKHFFELGMAASIKAQKGE